MADFVSRFVIAFFGSGEAALLLAGALLLWGAVLIALSNMREYQPMVGDLTRLLNVLGEVRGDRRQAQATFFKEFDTIDRAFSADSLESAELAIGWGRFKNTLIPTHDGRFLATARSADAFDRLDGSAQSLDWWANILVAVGLVITFLGITAALAEVAQAVNSPGEAANVQGAMVGLLAIAATKFWTSIAGVMASVVLRLAARRRRGRIHQLESALFNGLDRCVDFAGSEAIALRQLELLERIEGALGSQPERRAEPVASLG
jgi:hypothetical protein